MNFNDVDIYTCKFFTLNNEGKLQFYGGAHKGKTVDDFKTIADLKKIIAYCFWIITHKDAKGKNMPIVSQYAATAFLKALIPKFNELEKITREKTVNEQKRLKKKTQELTKTTGKRYA